MQGVTTAIVAFIFICILFPRLVKNRAQFWSAVVAVVLMIALDALAQMAGPENSFRVLAYVITAFLQIGAIVLLVLSAGGLTVEELAGDLRDAYEVIRRGEEEKEVIIPSLRKKQQAAAGTAVDDDDDDEDRVVFSIDEHGNDVVAKPPPPAQPPAPPEDRPKKDAGPIPLE